MKFCVRDEELKGTWNVSFFKSMALFNTKSKRIEGKNRSFKIRIRNFKWPIYNN